MKKLKTLLVVALVSLMSLAVVTENAFAKGSRSSSSRSSSRSYSKPSPSRSYSKPKPKPAPRVVKPKTVAPKVTPKAAPAPTKSWGGKPKSTTPKTSRATTAKPKMSAAKSKSLETAKKNDTSFKSKDAATAAFKKNQAGKYPSKYASKPATRPEHIPQSTMVGGRSVNITYNNGGYGYTNSLGAFIMYDMMSDAIMRDRYMSRSNYMVQPAVVATTPVVVQRPVVVRSGPSVGIVIFWTIVVIGGIVALVCVCNKLSLKKD